MRVHTLMFYDLFRPAPVYGNESFNYLYKWMSEQYQVRRLWHFPEAAWWLTFDIAVPLYLPITIEARHRDIQGIKFMLAGGLDGHHVFGTGHEWGYWQNEYCSFRMAADTHVSFRDCIADITSPMGAAAPTVAIVMEEIIEHQERDLIYGGIIEYLVGTDSETEIAAAAGIVFHPLPPAVSEILTWDMDKVARWQSVVASKLDQMDADYAEAVATLSSVAGDVPDDARPWFDEILDGIEVTGTRARHARHVYGAVVTYRQSQLEGDPILLEGAQGLFAAAQADTEAALEIIHRREEGYRYAPLSRSIAGGPNGTEDDNWTIYDYRYLNRTHHAFYYTRIDDMVAEVLAGAMTPLAVDDALLGPGEELVARALDVTIAEIEVDFGDGNNDTGNPVTWSYTEPGVYSVELRADRGGEEVTLGGDVAVLESEDHTVGDAETVDPAGASLVAPLVPDMVFGPIDDARLAVGFSAVGDGRVRLDRWWVFDNTSDTDLRGTADLLMVPLMNGGAVVANFTIANPTISVLAGGERVEIDGQLSTDGVVDALVSIGGFDEEGAIMIVAATLGYSPETLPEQVSFVVAWDLD